MGTWVVAEVDRFAHDQRVAPLWPIAARPVGAALAAAGGLIARTSRVTIEGPGKDVAGPAVFVHWHRHVPFLVGHHGERGRWMLVGAGPELEPMASWCAASGLRVVRVPREGGAVTALIALREALARGESVTLAVDGPAGPAFRAKRGCVELARAAGVPIVPVAFTSARGRAHPGRWDRMVVPVPFDRIAVRYGAPLVPGPDEPLEDALARVGAALDALDPR